jgi:hypothetical protein
MGGFQESLVAMMVITAGITMLVAAMALLPADSGNEAIEPSGMVLERIAGDERWTISPGVLLHRDMDEVAIEPADVGCQGVRVLLQEVDGPTLVLFESGQMNDGERFASSRPVNVHYGPQQVTAALLTVWVWT